MTFRRFMSFTAMAFLWTGSQIPVYLFGMSKPRVLLNAMMVSHAILHQAESLPISMATLVEQIDGSGL